ncbi:spore coat U domain-containing protein [Zavarzinia compransoris]|uniref:spore coat protein U domain-containing protein n=1 Tax=Zavarzinia marina TaxID=2911065 RepID=UPI001F19BCF0|nr:spore coat protein U domain-containing protein [Zavarzinia marina]MCF4165011.1 spore coat U domain-containing protein [Zavarzinia marina]
MTRRLPIPVLIAAVLACGLALLAPRPAQALTRLCGLIATCTCNMSVPSTINFNTYDPFSATDLTTAGSASVSCSSSGLISGSITYTLTLSQGAHGTYAARRMAPSVGTIQAQYNLYTNSGHTTVLGDGSGTTAIFSASCSGALLFGSSCNNSHNYYGKVPAGQTTLVPATYSDTLVWSLDF